MSGLSVEVSSLGVSRDSLYVEIASEFLNTLLPYEDTFNLPTVSFGQDRKILSRLIPSYKYKLDKGLVESSKEPTLDVIREAVTDDRPIPLIVNIGTSKWFDGSNYEKNIAGFSELLMLEQLSLMNRRVQVVYERGASCTLLAEDVTNDWLYSQINDPVAVSENNIRYLKTLGSMVDKVGESLATDIRLVRESDLLSNNALIEYLALLEENKRLFREYFEATIPLEAKFLVFSDSLSLNVSVWEEYVSQVLPTVAAYQLLCESGWMGGVHPLQRQYYERQFGKSGGEEAQDIDYISGYFGSVLARKQMRFIQSAAGLLAIKVAFLRYPNGTSDREKAALTVSQHPLYGRGASHKRISPWAANTNIEIDKQERASLNVRLARNKRHLAMLDELQIKYAGVDVPIGVLSNED